MQIASYDALLKSYRIDTEASAHLTERARIWHRLAASVCWAGDEYKSVRRIIAVSSLRNTMSNTVARHTPDGELAL